MSGVSGGGGEDDTCLLQTSPVEMLAEAQGTLLELPNLFFWWVHRNLSVRVSQIEVQVLLQMTGLHTS